MCIIILNAYIIEEKGNYCRKLFNNAKSPFSIGSITQRKHYKVEDPVYNRWMEVIFEQQLHPETLLNNWLLIIHVLPAY